MTDTLDAKINHAFLNAPNVVIREGGVPSPHVYEAGGIIRWGGTEYVCVDNTPPDPEHAGMIKGWVPGTWLTMEQYEANLKAILANDCDCGGGNSGDCQCNQQVSRCCP